MPVQAPSSFITYVEGLVDLRAEPEVVEGQVAVSVHGTELVALLIEAEPRDLSKGSSRPGAGHNTRVLPLPNRYRPVLTPYQVWGMEEGGRGQGVF